MKGALAFGGFAEELSGFLGACEHAVALGVVIVPFHLIEIALQQQAAVFEGEFVAIEWRADGDLEEAIVNL